MMHIRKSTARAALGLGLALACATAFAAVSFDPDTGIGFVGKGDVQDAFSWNNAALQNNAAGVSFSYEATTTYAALCTFTTGDGRRGQTTHYVPHTIGLSVSSEVNHVVRRHHQIDGFELTGFGDSFSETGTVPVVGSPCMGNQGHDGIWTGVEQLEGGEGGLYVNYGSIKVLLQ
ncbi:MAG TPA: hypothetical protein VIK70_11755 [Lysobacter sp.]